MKLNIVILDNDKIYLERMVKYFLNYHSNEINITTFSEIGPIKEYIKTEQSAVDVYIINENLIGEFKEKGPANYLILKEEMSSKKVKNEVYKYQAGDRFVQNIFEKAHKVLNISGSKIESKVISVYSPIGGIGKTSIAIRLVNYLARNKKVFYLNLEVITDTKYYFKEIESKHTISNVFYNLEEPDSTHIIKDYVYKYTDNIHTFLSAENGMEFFDVDDKKVKSLINKLKRSGYDYIIVDLESKFDKECLESLKISDRVLLLNYEGGNPKVDKFYKMLSSLKDGSEILNKIEEINIDDEELKLPNKVKNIFEAS